MTWRRATLGLAVVALLAVACSSGSAEPEPTLTLTPTSTATPIPRPTATPTPNFTLPDAAAIVQSQASELPFPGNTRFILCVIARYIPGNHTWVVECNYTVESAPFIDALQASDATKTFLLDDETGLLIR